MANRERGEVELVAGSASYTLVLSMNAVCEMQTRTNKTYGQLLLSMRSLDFLALRDILWMTLKKHHGKQFKSAEQVGDLIDELEAGPATAVEVLTEMFTLNAARGKPEDNGNPPPAQ